MQNQYICVVFESWLGGRGTIIIARSMHLYSFGKLVWGEGALESVQNQSILCGLGKLIGGQGTRIIAQSMHLYGFGRLVGGGAPESLQP